MDIELFIEKNLTVEDGNIIKFRGDIAELRKLNKICGTGFEGTEGSIVMSKSVKDFKRMYGSLFDNMNGMGTHEAYLKLLEFSAEKGYGDEPFFRYKALQCVWTGTWFPSQV